MTCRLSKETHDVVNEGGEAKERALRSPLATRTRTGSPAIPRVGTKLVPIGPQRLGLFGRLYRALRNTKYGRLLLELMTRTLGCIFWAGPQHPGPLRGPPTAGPTLAMTNLPRGACDGRLCTDALSVLAAFSCPSPGFWEEHMHKICAWASRHLNRHKKGK